MKLIQKLVGLKLHDAIKKAGHSRIAIRPVMFNGQPTEVSLPYRAGRVNVEVEGRPGSWVITGVLRVE